MPKRSRKSELIDCIFCIHGTCTEMLLNRVIRSYCIGFECRKSERNCRLFKSFPSRSSVAFQDKIAESRSLISRCICGCTFVKDPRNPSADGLFFFKCER